MSYLEHFNKNTLKYDLINKFQYKNTKNLPKLEKIILNLGCKKTINTKNLLSNLIAIEFIGSQKGLLTFAKKPNMILKIRKGTPIGCKVTLRKQKSYCFINKVLTVSLPNNKNFKPFNIDLSASKNTFSFELYNILNFIEIEKYYSLFKEISGLKVTIIFNSSKRKELLFLVKSLQLIVQKT